MKTAHKTVAADGGAAETSCRLEAPTRRRPAGERQGVPS
jgi:hypothetical protein